MVLVTVAWFNFYEPRIGALVERFMEEQNALSFSFFSEQKTLEAAKYLS